MSVGTVWVHTEVAEGSVASITLEILAKAREISSDVVAIVGGDGDAVAAELGAHGATTVLATGDLGGALPAHRLLALWQLPSPAAQHPLRS